MATPFFKTFVLSTANPYRDGSSGTGYVQIHIGASSNLTRMDRLRIQATGPTTKGAIRLFLKKSGGSRVFKREYQVDAISAQDLADGAEPWSLDIDMTRSEEAVYLMQNDTLEGTTNNAETFHGMAWGGDN